MNGSKRTERTKEKGNGPRTNEDRFNKFQTLSKVRNLL